MGKGLMDAGRGLAQVATDMRLRDDADSALRSNLGLRDAYIGFEMETRQNRQGRFAQDLTADTGKWFDEKFVRPEKDGDTESDSQRGENEAEFMLIPLAERDVAKG